MMSKHRDDSAKTRKQRRIDEFTSWQTDTIAFLSIFSISAAVCFLFIYRDNTWPIAIALISAILLMFIYGWIRVWMSNRRETLDEPVS